LYNIFLKNSTKNKIKCKLEKQTFPKFSRTFWSGRGEKTTKFVEKPWGRGGHDVPENQDFNFNF
jgi:hypothetical protein